MPMNQLPTQTPMQTNSRPATWPMSRVARTIGFADPIGTLASPLLLRLGGPIALPRFASRRVTSLIAGIIGRFRATATGGDVGTTDPALTSSFFVPQWLVCQIHTAIRLRLVTRLAGLSNTRCTISRALRAASRARGASTALLMMLRASLGWWCSRYCLSDTTVEPRRSRTSTLQSGGTEAEAHSRRTSRKYPS
jgi:hypothetical protein